MHLRSNFTSTYHGLAPVQHSVCHNSFFNVKALVGAFNQEEAPVIGNLREGKFAALVLSVLCPQGGKNTAELCKHFLLGVGPLHHEAQRSGRTLDGGFLPVTIN